MVRDRPCVNTGASRLFGVTDFQIRCNEKEAKYGRNEFCEVGSLDCEAGVKLFGARERLAAPFLDDAALQLSSERKRGIDEPIRHVQLKRTPAALP